MSKPLPLQNLFDAGMKRDFSRNRMPPNSAWNIRDIVLNYGAPARERGGWAYASTSLTAINASANSVRGGIFAIFSPTSGILRRNIAVDQTGYVYLISTSGAPGATGVGSAVQIAQNPIFHGGTAVSGTTQYTGLVLFMDATMNSVPRKYNGTSITNLNGNPPRAKFGTVFKDYTVLGHGYFGTTYFPNRIWFSPPGDPDLAVSGSQTAWNTTDSWIDFSLPVEGMGSTKNVMLVFHEGQVSRVRGSTPPPEEDMVVDDPWQRVGLLDPFSITEYQDQIFWCAPEGVFSTDGVSLNDITLKGGMLRYWLDLVAQAGASWRFATGIQRNRLFISITNGTEFVDAFMIDLQTYAWVRLSNFRAVSMWSGLYDKSDETYFGLIDQPRVGRIDTIFSVDNSAYKNDANGVPVASVLETPFYEFGRPGIKNVKSVYFGYHLRDWASDDPTVTVSHVSTPESSTYVDLGTLGENAAYDRVRVPIGGRYWGMAFRFARTGPGDLHGYDISAEVGYQEESKRMS